MSIAEKVVPELDDSFSDILAQTDHSLLERAKGSLRAHPLPVIFVLLGLFVRVLFWVVTGRVWEDALITITPAKNFWAGNGLTHHISEPAVHSFTSPASVLIPLLGEGFGKGLLFLRLSSLAASSAAIIFAYRIGLLFKWARPTFVLVLSFLAFDQLQVFFGMAGMETQVSTAVLLAGVYALFAQRWHLLGVTLGLAALCRPEFGLWILAGGVAMILHQRRKSMRPTLIATAIVAPWVVFATWYYGSPIPHTIVAKNMYPSVSNRSVDAMVDQAGNLWKTVAPFRSYTFTASTPFPPFLLQLVAFAIIAFGLFGAWHAARQNLLNLAPAAFVGSFYLYETVALVPSYFMWYIPPVAAVIFIFAGIGVNELLKDYRPARWLFSLFIALMYAIHIPFTYPLEARVQRDVEVAVRSQVGKYLNAHMRPDDAVVLEPLGFIGWEAFNKTTYDYPGLSSTVVTDALASHPKGDRSILRLVVDLMPTYLAFRQGEWDAFIAQWPVESAQYEVVADFQSPPALQLTRGGVSYFNIDTHFIVAKRID